MGVKEASAGREIVTVAAAEKLVIRTTMGILKSALLENTSGAANQNSVSVCAMTGPVASERAKIEIRRERSVTRTAVGFINARR